MIRPVSCKKLGLPKDCTDKKYASELVKYLRKERLAKARASKLKVKERRRQKKLGIGLTKRETLKVRTRLKEKALEAVKKWVKHRDNYTCQKCGKKLEASNCHASHVYSVGAYPNLAHDPQNLKTLCYRCHIMWWHKNPFEASEWFQHTFPDRYKYLQEAKNKVSNYTADDYKKMLETFASCK